MERANPYADFGATVRGGRFIGRASELRMISSRVFGPGAFGSLAIIGLPRFGKTSLIAEAIRRSDAESSVHRTVVVRLSVGEFDSISEMFTRLIEALREVLEERNLSNLEIERRVLEALSEDVVNFDLVRRVFRAMRRSNVRAVCVFDEFDSGRRLFADTPQCFHWLRELCSNPQFKAGVIFVSKRRLQDVSRLAGHESDYWQNVLMVSGLGAFSDGDIELFFAKLASDGVSMDAACRDAVQVTCGSIPYLLDCFAFHAWERVWSGKLIEIDWVRHKCHELARRYVDHVVPILQDSSLLSKAMQILIGPQRDVTSEDIRSLEELGVVREDGGCIVPCLPALVDHLRSVAQEIEIWPLLGQAERALRSGLEFELESAYGSDWAGRLVRSRPKLGELILGCQERFQRDDPRATTGGSSKGLLKYAYPMDLYSIMCVDWKLFGRPLLGGDRHEWAIKFKLFAKVRTPLAHSREERVSVGDRVYAEGVFREIVERYRGWRQRKGLE